jgi:hypothetical protein
MSTPFSVPALSGTLLFLVLAVTAFAQPPADAPADPLAVSAKGKVDDWSAPVQGFKPLEPGEHPRLLFRKADVPALRQRAATPEGKLIIARLRATLNGKDGETMPTEYNKIGSAYAGNADLPFGSYSMSHAAGYGLLYQLTGDKKYAEMGKQCFEKAFEGIRDRDGQGRYSFRNPGGALRAGPSLGWYALGYDLCYDGWDADFRVKVAKEISEYNKGKKDVSLEDLARGVRQFPACNHWGMIVGGGGMACLAITGDPGVDQKKIDSLLKANAMCMVQNMTVGFGDGGFFPEGDGTGSMASHIIFLTALQGWKTAMGKDFVSPKPNAQWLALKWMFLTIPSGDMGKIADSFPKRGDYPQNIWGRTGLSGAGYFCIPFGILSDDQKAAQLWYYNKWLKAWDDNNNTPFDTPSPYPHYGVLSFVNWPMGMAEKDPDDVVPHAYRDTKWGFYAWRNRWQDADDTVISILTKTAKGNMQSAGEKTLTVWSQGKRMTWGGITSGFKGDYAPAKNGSTVLTCGDGSCLAIDFSGASGADAMLVMTGPGAPAKDTVTAGGVKFSFLFLTKGAAPTPKAEGDRVIVGGQIVSFDGKALILAK